MDQTNQEFFDAAASGDFAKVCASVAKGANVNNFQLRNKKFSKIILKTS